MKKFYLLILLITFLMGVKFTQAFDSGNWKKIDSDERKPATKVPASISARFSYNDDNQKEKPGCRQIAEIDGFRYFFEDEDRLSDYPPKDVGFKTHQDGRNVALSPPPTIIAAGSLKGRLGMSNSR